MWIDIIKKKTDVTIERGYLCDLHFSPTDIQNRSGRVYLKSCAIPIDFESPENPPLLESNETHHDTNYDEYSELQPSCNECHILRSERDELKHILFKTQIDSANDLQNLNKKNDNLKNKCHEKSLIISDLQKKIASLEKTVKAGEQQIENLRGKDQSLQGLDVIFYT